jgi:hypothetical protein
LAQAIYGTLGNFDTVNDTGKTAHGFEIDLEGISVSDVHDTFGGGGRGFPSTVERYGAPNISATATGVSIVYGGISTWSGSAWTVGTPSGTISTGGESCWTGGGLGYGPSTPCDHFGVGTTKTPTATTYKWLTEISGSSSALTPTAATLPAAVMSVPTPPVAGAPPNVVGHVDALPPEGALFGTAEWVKVFTIQYDNPVVLGQLLGNNGIVPQGSSEVEVEWALLQAGLIDGLDNAGDAGAGKESVLRRYEFYKYLGPFDAEGQALCEDPALCAGAVGAFVGDQNLALNVNGYYFGAAVPEPQTYSMMLSGLGALAIFALRRRQKSV